MGQMAICNVKANTCSDKSTENYHQLRRSPYCSATKCSSFQLIVLFTAPTYTLQTGSDKPTARYTLSTKQQTEKVSNLLGGQKQDSE